MIAAYLWGCINEQ